MEFDELLKKLKRLAGDLPPRQDAKAEEDGSGTPKRNATGDKPSERPKPKGRRNLETSNLPEVRVEIPDPLFEQLVLEGKAKRIGTSEDSSKLAYERGGPRRVVMLRVKYQTVDAQGETAIETAPLPPEVLMVRGTRVLSPWRASAARRAERGAAGKPTTFAADGGKEGLRWADAALDCVLGRHSMSWTAHLPLSQRGEVDARPACLQFNYLQ